MLIISEYNDYIYYVRYTFFIFNINIVLQIKIFHNYNYKRKERPPDKNQYKVIFSSELQKIQKYLDNPKDKKY